MVEMALSLPTSVMNKSALFCLHIRPWIHYCPSARIIGEAPFFFMWGTFSVVIVDGHRVIVATIVRVNEDAILSSTERRF